LIKLSTTYQCFGIKDFIATSHQSIRAASPRRRLPAWLVGINNPAALEVVVASSVAVEVIVFVWCEVVVEVSVEVEE
jgi:hypothetical protein